MGENSRCFVRTFQDSRNIGTNLPDCTSNHKGQCSGYHCQISGLTVSNAVRFVRPYIQETVIVCLNKHVIPSRTLCNLCSKYSIAKQLRTVTTGPAIELNHFLCSCFVLVVCSQVIGRVLNQLLGSLVCY